jgi:hypothetical protein
MNCLFCGDSITYGDKRKKFCDSSCAASFNNAKRASEGFSLKDKKKTIECVECHRQFEVAVNTSNNSKCPSCAPPWDATEYYKSHYSADSGNLIICEDCEKEVSGCVGRKYCDLCSKIRKIQGSRNSVLAQKENRRSKNEAYFAELCKNYFGADDIKTNEPMFDGWDADIIIESYKLAILWNGKWHYEKITVKHSVAQVQNRDKIKISKIMAYNYIPYVIKDMGSFDREFVEREFSSMVERLSHKQNTTVQFC